MGILYDRNGVVEHNGLWKNDKPYSSEFDRAMMGSRTESIILSEHSFNEVESFVFPPFLGLLKRIDIGDDCFGSIRSLKLTGLIELESVTIGKRCFTHATSETQMFVEMGSDGTFEITDCPNLKSLQIGDFSFADYHLLEVEILPSLQQVVVGSYAFHWSYLFSLSGLPELHSIQAGSYAFKKTPFFSLTNLPHLQSISLGYCTLYRCQCIELESRCRL